MNMTYTIIEEPNIISARTVLSSCLRKVVNLLGKAGYLQMQRFCLHSSIHWIWLTVFSGSRKWYRLGTTARPEKGLSCSNVPHNTSLLPAFINTMSMTHYIYRNRKIILARLEKRLSCSNLPHITILLHASFQPCVEGGFALNEKYVKRYQTL